MKTQLALRSAAASLLFISVAACSPPQAASALLRDVCSTCGVVQSVSPVTQAGGSTGAGAVIGAVVGGVAGNQVGGGSGKDIATAAGVVGGALIGNNIEKNRSTSTSYEIVVSMDDGGCQTLNVLNPGGISPGSMVNVSGGNITLR